MQDIIELTSRGEIHKCQQLSHNRNESQHVQSFVQINPHNVVLVVKRPAPWQAVVLAEVGAVLALVMVMERALGRRQSRWSAHTSQWSTVAAVFQRFLATVNPRSIK